MEILGIVAAFLALAVGAQLYGTDSRPAEPERKSP
jgi:hypothetical protein